MTIILDNDLLYCRRRTALDLCYNLYMSDKIQPKCSFCDKYAYTEKMHCDGSFTQHCVDHANFGGGSEFKIR
jgi:hypothetical protein